MPLEIEFKFIVAPSWLSSTARKTAVVLNIEQGYISTTPEATVRVRIKDEHGFLTIKGKAKGPVRSEFEYPIPYTEAKELLSLCKKRIHKKRYLVPFGDHTWEVDEFEGENAPLILAEIELDHPDSSFQKPSWIRRDVTQDHRYSNSSLSLSPYQDWYRDA